MTGMVMKRIEFDAMSADDLWSLHVEVSQLLQQRIQAEKLRLEERLKQLEAPVSGRRPYPLVPPKYRNPDQPQRPGPGVANSRAGWWRSCARVSGSTISESRMRRIDAKPPPDPVHSRTSYSKAAPSGSFSSNQVSAASVSLMLEPPP